MKKLTQAGDTIVEVLIAMLVISVILGGAFVTTHNSQNGVRDSQEHAEALKLAESQLEQLRADASGPSPTVFGATTPFCMYNSQVSPGASNNCQQNSSGVPTSTEPIYHLVITRLPSNGGFIFTIDVNWAEVNGHGSADEKMVYRLYQ